MQILSLSLTLSNNTTFTDICEACSPKLYSFVFGSVSGTEKNYTILIPDFRLSELKIVLKSHQVDFKINSHLAKPFELLVLNFLCSMPPIIEWNKNTPNTENLQNLFQFQNPNLNIPEKNLPELLIEAVSELISKENVYIDSGKINPNPNHLHTKQLLEQTQAALTRNTLLYNIKSNKHLLEQTLKEVTTSQLDLFYRVYHHSFKAYHLQKHTVRIYELFKTLTSNELNQEYNSIINAGTNIKFDLSHNSDWWSKVSKILEAYSHSKFFLEAMLETACSTEYNQTFLDSHWASVLYLYNLR